MNSIDKINNQYYSQIVQYCSKCIFLMRTDYGHLHTVSRKCRKLQWAYSCLTVMSSFRKQYDAVVHISLSKNVLHITTCSNFVPKCLDSGVYRTTFKAAKTRVSGY